MQQHLVTLFSRVHFPLDDQTPVAAKHVTALNAEAASLGYSFDGQLLQQMRRVSRDNFPVLRAVLLRALQNAAGADVEHAALFNKFPYETPDQWMYLIRRIMGHMEAMLDMRPNQVQVLSCGHVMDLRLFDLKDFSACPICQFQVEEAVAHEHVLHDFQRITPLKILSYADDSFIRDKANALLARNSSLSAAEREFLISARTLGGLTRPSAVYRENLPFVYSFFADLDYVKTLLSGATDVMRIAAYLSDANADLSLKALVKFRLSTRHKKNMLRLLEDLAGRGRITEDLLRHRERWLRLGEQLHPGSTENRRRFPKTAAAFDRLRNDPETIDTFNRTVERKLRGKIIDAELLRTLSSRPAEFLRRIDVLLRTAEDAGPILQALCQIVTKAPTKLLFEIDKYLGHRAAATGAPRLFVPKGQANKLQVAEDMRAPIAADLIGTVQTIVRKALWLRFTELPSLGRVYIDPALRNIVMPFNRRGDSTANTAIVKGSRYPLTAKEIVRLFVWWKGNVDVDLSMACYNEDFVFITQISWTNLKGFACVHSGDIQNAPNGASEFIDFDLADLRERYVRYVIASVISYRGQTFDEFPCFAGFMERDALKSGKKFEPESVALRFDLTAQTRSYLPLIFDLEAMQVVFADIAAGGGMHATVMGGTNKLVALAKATLDLPNTKPTAYDVLAIHAQARGQHVEDPTQADTAFTIDNLDLEHVMAMMSTTTGVPDALMARTARPPR